jgi:uncharacterized protein YraI
MDQMRRYALPFAAAVMATAALPSVASAADAVVTTELNMRAGPSTAYPVVEVIPADAPVEVHGCVRGYSWCDVTWQDARGWVSGGFLTALYRERYVPLVEYATVVDVPIIGFSFDPYWDSYYRSRPWYAQRARWRHAYRDDRRDFRADRVQRREDRRDLRTDRSNARSEFRDERRRDSRAERRYEGRAYRDERQFDRRERTERREGRIEGGGERTTAAGRFEASRDRGGSGPQMRDRGGPSGGGGAAVRPDGGEPRAGGGGRGRGRD